MHTWNTCRTSLFLLVCRLSVANPHARPLEYRRFHLGPLLIPAVFVRSSRLNDGLFTFRHDVLPGTSENSRRLCRTRQSGNVVKLPLRLIIHNVF